MPPLRLARLPVPQRPACGPIVGDCPRPLVSVMIPTYECARFLEQALRSVLEQDLGARDMEIVVVDDCSQGDDPQAVVRRVAGDRVQFVRQPVNVGHVRNFNACLSMARGQWVHLLHGDDLVLPGFYDSVVSVVKAHPEVGAVLCRFWWADEAGTLDRPGWLQANTSGVLPDWPARLAERQRLEAPSIVVRRSVYEELGGFDEGIAGYGEDWEMWLRIAVHAPVWYDPRAMAVYRVRPGSLSDPSKLRSNMRDMRRVVGLNAGSLAAVLPAAQVRRLTQLARKQVGLSQLRRANNARLAGATVLPLAPVREALRMHPSPEVLARCVLLLVRSVRSLRPAASRTGRPPFVRAVALTSSVAHAGLRQGRRLEQVVRARRQPRSPRGAA